MAKNRKKGNRNQKQCFSKTTKREEVMVKTETFENVEKVETTENVELLEETNLILQIKTFFRYINYLKNIISFCSLLYEYRIVIELLLKHFIGS